MSQLWQLLGMTPFWKSGTSCVFHGVQDVWTDWGRKEKPASRKEGHGGTEGEGKKKGKQNEEHEVGKGEGRKGRKGSTSCFVLKFKGMFEVTLFAATTPPRA